MLQRRSAVPAQLSGLVDRRRTGATRHRAGRQGADRTVDQRGRVQQGPDQHLGQLRRAGGQGRGDGPSLRRPAVGAASQHHPNRHRHPRSGRASCSDHRRAGGTGHRGAVLHRLLPPAGDRGVYQPGPVGFAVVDHHLAARRHADARRARGHRRVHRCVARLQRGVLRALEGGRPQWQEPQVVRGEELPRRLQYHRQGGCLQPDRRRRALLPDRRQRSGLCVLPGPLGAAGPGGQLLLHAPRRRLPDPLQAGWEAIALRHSGVVHPGRVGRSAGARPAVRPRG